MDQGLAAESMLVTDIGTQSHKIGVADSRLSAINGRSISNNPTAPHNSGRQGRVGP